MKNNDLEPLYSEAEQYLQRNDMHSAAALYTRLCEADPESAEPWFILGLIHGELGASPMAKDCLYRAVELDPAHSDAHFNLAHHLLATGDVAQALAHCEKALSHDPDYSEAWLFQSSLLASIGKHEEAVTAIHKALALDPALPNAWAKAAHLHFKLDNTEQALYACHKALQHDATDMESSHLLGTLLLKMQQPVDAQAAFARVLQAQPDNVEALRGLGYACLQVEQYSDAKTHYTRSLELDPDCAASWLVLSHVYGKELIFDKAANYAERAVALEPTEPAAHTQLAQMLQSMGRFDDALTHFDVALVQAPQNIEALAGRANLHEKMGHHDKALQDLGPLLEITNTPPQALLTYARIAPRINDTSNAIKRLERLASELGEGQGQQVYHQLGCLCEHQGEYQQAFSYFSRANQLRNSDYDVEATERLVDWIIDEYNAAALSTTPRSTHKTELPIFVVGMLRSGTTLTEQIIASHPLVRGGGELQELPQISNALAENAEQNLLRPPAISQLDTECLDKAASNYLDRLATLSEGSVRITDKMLYNVFHLGLIALLFPHSRIIHCVRDPMDTCLSNFLQNYSGYRGFATDLAHTGHFYRQFDRLMNHWNSVLDLPILKVDYESLVSNQTAVTREIIDFCGLPWDPACLAFHENPRLVSTASYNQIRQPMYDSAVTRWRHYEPYLDPLKKALGLD